MSVNKTQVQHKSEETMKTHAVANWQAIGIGTMIGVPATGLVFAFAYSMDLFDNQGRLAFAGWEILLSVVGAMIGKSRKKTLRAMWIGAILGALSPGFLAIIWVLVVILIAGTLIG